MDPAKVSNLDKARDNARLFAQEMTRRVPAIGRQARNWTARKKAA